MSKTNLTGHPSVRAARPVRRRLLPLLLHARDAVRPGRQLPWESMVERHNADLANGLGQPREPGARDARFLLRRRGARRRWSRAPSPTCPRWSPTPSRRYDEHMLAVQSAAGARRGVGHRAIAPTTTWSRRSPGSSRRTRRKRDELAGVLYAAAETLRILAILICPIMPGGRRAACGASSARPSRSRISACRRVGRQWGRPRGGHRPPTKGESSSPRLRRPTERVRAADPAAPEVIHHAFTQG